MLDMLGTPAACGGLRVPVVLTGGAHAPQGEADHRAAAIINVAFLRTVTVGRGGMAKAVVLEAFSHCGAADAGSFLATGDVVFQPREGSTGALVDCVSSALEASHGLREPICVRSVRDLQMAQSLEARTEKKDGEVVNVWIGGESVMVGEGPIEVERRHSSRQAHHPDLRAGDPGEERHRAPSV